MRLDSLLSNQLENLANGIALSGDYDADGDADIFISGNGEDSAQILLYRNDGLTGYTEIDPGFPSLLHSHASWNDYDLDGDLDIFYTGAININDSLIPQAYLFNNADGLFQAIATNIDGVYKGYSTWSDFDNDGDEDLLVSGAVATTNNGWMVYTSCKLYLNEGMGVFSKTNPGIKAGYQCKMDVSDYDKDGDVDLVICGEIYDDGGFWQRLTELYRNNGDNSFSVVQTGLPKLRAADLAFGDFDNDGFTDIIFSGDPPSPTNLVYVFRNDGDGGFYDIGIEIIGTIDGSIDWADYDNDGDLDFLISGIQFPTADYPVTQIYRNAGNDMFSNDHTIEIQGLMNSSVSWGDLDNDLDPDLLITGYAEKNKINPLSLVYMNENSVQNTPPIPPQNISSEPGENDVILSWDAGFDAETPYAGLSYNLKLGTFPGGGDIISPMALTDGYRQVFRSGNHHQSLSTYIRGLEEGTYYWSVQSVDHGFIGSEFIQEQSFTIEITDIVATPAHEDYQVKVYPVPVRDRIQLWIDSPVNEQINIKLTSTSGIAILHEVAYQISNGENNFTFHLEDAISGAYILSIHSGSQLIDTRTIIISGK